MNVVAERPVKLSQLVENTQSLRPLNPKTEGFAGLVQSIKDSGFQSQITVREKKLEDGSIGYEIIDGLHRSSAAREAGLEEVSAKILDCTDEEMLKLQMQMNWHHIPTSHKQFQSHIELLMGHRPNITRAELAAELGISTTNLDNIMKLKNIKDSKILKLIADGDIKLVNAYALGSLDPDDQVSMLDSAMKDPATEFVPKVQQRVKEVREARRQGKEKTPITFMPIAQLRKLSEMTAIVENKDAINTIVSKLNPKSVVDAFTLGLLFAIRLDPISVESQKNEFERKEQAKAEKRAASARELELKRIQKKEKELAELQEKAATKAIEVEAGTIEG